MAFFARFTERAQRALIYSQEEARNLGHNYVGTEHLLLGLLREGEGAAAKILPEPNESWSSASMKPEIWVTIMWAPSICCLP